MQSNCTALSDDNKRFLQKRDFYDFIHCLQDQIMSVMRIKECLKTVRSERIVHVAELKFDAPRLIDTRRDLCISLGMYNLQANISGE